MSSAYREHFEVKETGEGKQPEMLRGVRDCFSVEVSLAVTTIVIFTVS